MARHSTTESSGHHQSTGLAGLLGRPSPRALRVPPATEEIPVGGPSIRHRLGELTGVLQAARLLRSAPWLARAPRGHGETVIDLPGWKAPEASNLAMRIWLRRLGYDARSWGLGTNSGAVERDVEVLVDRLRRSPEAPPVALLGWSLGGVVAREIARVAPERVARVITYGSPVVGGAGHTIFASSYRDEESERIVAESERLAAEDPIRVPITAIYSRRDGVVDWRACIDRASLDVSHVEVGSTHLALGLDPDVWWTVATVLSDTFRETDL